MCRQELLRYIPFPEQLKGKYQSYTQADMRALRGAGYFRCLLECGAGCGKVCELFAANANLKGGFANYDYKVPGIVSEHPCGASDPTGGRFPVRAGV